MSEDAAEKRAEELLEVWDKQGRKACLMAVADALRVKDEELEAARNQLRDGVVCVKCGGDFTNFDELCHKCSDELRQQAEARQG